MSTKRVSDLTNETKEFIIDLLAKNMRKLYEDSKCGWNDKNKRKEMLDDKSWYLLATTSDGTIAGYSHFKYDMYFNDEVVNVHEIQIVSTYQRKGLGRFMMQVLEMLAFKADMRKIMLTVLKHNPDAEIFFKKTMKYEIDETCPVDNEFEQYDYEILSKLNKRKPPREPTKTTEMDSGSCRSTCCK